VLLKQAVQGAANVDQMLANIHLPCQCEQHRTDTARLCASSISDPGTRLCCQPSLYQRASALFAHMQH
jgi:hypothetical protein